MHADGWTPTPLDGQTNKHSHTTTHQINLPNLTFLTPDPAQTQVFLLAGDLVKPEAAHTLMQLVAEGTGEDDDADAQLRRDAVENYARLLVAAGGRKEEEEQEQVLPAVLPDVLVQALAWILGEYGYLSESVGQAELVHRLAAEMAHRPFHDPATRGFVVSGVVKLVAQTGTLLRLRMRGCAV